MRQVLQALEEKNLLLQLLDRLVAPASQVALGDELGVEQLTSMAVVAASYQTPDGARGVIGLLGPMRMDYARLVPLVEFSAHAVTQHLLKERE